MCGRYTLRRINLIFTWLDAMPTLPFEEFSERPRFNIAPSQMIPVARLDQQGQRVLDVARWGFIPYGSKSLPRYQPCNARDDRLKKGMFRAALERRRCLIPADGFYEWKAEGKKQPKQPYFFHFKDDRAFAFAGLWERWKPGEPSEGIETCALITTEPNDLVKPIHDRMPAIIRPEDYARWLDPKTPLEDALLLLRPYPAQEMEAFPIGLSVNRPENDGPRVLDRDQAAPIEPAAIERPNAQGGLFDQIAEHDQKPDSKV